jgi:hypothetical protein
MIAVELQEIRSLFKRISHSLNDERLLNVHILGGWLQGLEGPLVSSYHEHMGVKEPSGLLKCYFDPTHCDRALQSGAVHPPTKAILQSQWVTGA